MLFNACRVHRSALKHKDWTVWKKAANVQRTALEDLRKALQLSASTEGGCSSWRVNPSRSLQSVPRQVLVLMLGVGGALEVKTGSKAIMKASAGSLSWEHLVFHQLLQRLHLSDVILF